MRRINKVFVGCFIWGIIIFAWMVDNVNANYDSNINTQISVREKYNNKYNQANFIDRFWKSNRTDLFIEGKDEEFILEYPVGGSSEKKKYEIDSICEYTSKIIAKYDIDEISEKLRQIYFDKPQFYINEDDPNFLQGIDDIFVMALSDTCNVTAYFTPEDFGIPSGSLFDYNSDKENARKINQEVFSQYLKKTEYGIDHGYFRTKMGSGVEDVQLIDTPIVMQVAMPKGELVLELGDTLKDRDYIFTRNRAFKYNKIEIKTCVIDGNSYEYLLIGAELISLSEFKKIEQAEAAKINNHLQDKDANFPSDFISFNLVGLNAGSIFKESEEIMKSFDILEFPNERSLSENLFANGYLNYTNSYIYNTDKYDEIRLLLLNKNATQEEIRAELVESSADGSNFGVTYDDYDSLKDYCVSIVAHATKESINNYIKIEDPIKYNVVTFTTMHELFHNIAFRSEYFRSMPIFEGAENPEKKFEEVVQPIKDEIKDGLTSILNDPYNEDNPHEFMAEAFATRHSLDASMRKTFKDELPELHRFVDVLFDTVAPSTVGDLSVSRDNENELHLKFDHARDNLGVAKYDVSIKDSNSLESRSIEIPVEKVNTENKKGTLFPASPEGIVSIPITDYLIWPHEYSISVIAIDEAGNKSESTSLESFAAPNLSVPGFIGELKGRNISAGSSQSIRAGSSSQQIGEGIANVLNWSTPIDNDEVVKIEVNRTQLSPNGSNISNTVDKYELPRDSTHFLDIDIKRGAIYSYYVRVFDKAGNISEPSNIVYISTDDADDPIRNEDKVEGEITLNRANLKLDSLFIDEAVSGYVVYGFAADWHGVFSSVGVYSTIEDILEVQLVSLMLHQFLVIPLDSAGNILGDGEIITVVSSPRAPENVTVKEIAPDFVELVWENKNDVEKVPAEKVVNIIYRNNKFLTEVKGDVTTFKDTDVTPITSYNYEIVTRVGANNNSLPSDIQVMTPPYAPENLTAKEVTSDVVRLVWDNKNDLGKVSEEVINEIYRDNNLIGKVGGGVNYFEDTDLDMGIEYEYYIVTSIPTWQVESRASNTLKVVAGLDAPKNLRATEVTENLIRLEWGNMNKLSGVVNEIYCNGGFVTALSNEQNFYEHSSHDSFTEYEYKVIARLGEIQSESATILVKTLPSRPLYLTSTNITIDEVGFFWVYFPIVEANRMSFQIYRDNNLIDTVSNGMSYVDRTLEPGKTYSYQVAVVIDGTSVSRLSNPITLSLRPKYNLRTVKIMSSYKPLNDQTSRSSLNMDVLPYRDNYKIFVNPVYNPASRDNIRFNIKYDKPLFADPVVVGNVSHNTVISGPLDHSDSLYIADPSGAIDDFEVVIECYDNKP